jgi:hypothetical protein
MPEIFGRVPLTFGGGFAADAANIFFGLAAVGAGGEADVIAPLSGIGLLTQNVNIQYQQPINRLYEVGGEFEYFVAGRPQGNFTLGRIVGPRAVSVAFYTTFGNVCLGPQTAIMFAGAAGCLDVPVIGEDGDNGFMFVVSGAILQGIGISVAAQDMVINEQLSFMFISLLVPTEDGTF